MATTRAEEFAAIAAAFNTGWAGATEIAWPNVSFTPTQGSSWVAFDLVPGEEVQMSIGQATNVFRQVSAVEITVFTPQNKGLATALGLVDSVEGIFRRLAIDNILFKKTRVFNLGENDGYFVFNVVCSYDRDSLK